MKSNESPAHSAAEATSGPGDESAPRWVGLNLPPIVEQHGARLRESPVVFQPSPRQSGASQIIVITVLVVVVVGPLATVAYFLTTGPGRTGDQGIAAPQPTSTPHDLPAPPAVLPAPVDTAMHS